MAPHHLPRCCISTPGRTRIRSRAAKHPGYGYSRQNNSTKRASPVQWTGRYVTEMQCRQVGYSYTQQYKASKLVFEVNKAIIYYY